MKILKVEIMYNIMRQWLLEVLIAIDQLCNTVFCDGWADETMSSNAYRMHKQGSRWGFMCIVINWIAYPLQKDHCHMAYESELHRSQSPPEER